MTTIANEDLSEVLQNALADTFRLMFKTKSYHWNATGVLFHALRTLTEEHCAEMVAAIDEIAEHVRAMDFMAPASLAEILDRSSLHDREAIPETREMALDLAASHTRVAESFRLIAAQAEHDAVTADLATTRARAHDKAAWMYRALSS